MKFLVFAVLAIAAPATAQTADPARHGTASDEAAAKRADRKICRDDARTSTRMISRTCRTAAEWQEIDARTFKTTDDMSFKARDN